MMLKLKKLIANLWVVLFLYTLQLTLAFAQVSNSVSSVVFSEIKESAPVDIKVALVNASSISRVQIAYKSFNETDFKIREMELLGDIARYQIGSDEVVAPILSYYLVIETRNGKRETYPIGIPGIARPIDLTVSRPSEKDKEILILSPESDETISVDELFISISLVNASDEVDISKTKIILNGIDISDNVMFAGDLLLYYPKNFGTALGNGSQTLEIRTYDAEGKLYHSIQRRFSTVDIATATKIKNGFKYYGNSVAEIRNEYFDNNSTLYSNIAVTLNGSINDWKFKGYGYLTSEEKSSAQAQNRYSISARNNWMNLRVGDSYPRYNNLLLNGKRVRGINGEIDYGVLHLQTSYGEINRGIDGKLLQKFSKDNAPLKTNVVRIDSARYGSTFGEVDFGVYSRKLLAARVGIGNKEIFEMGLSFLHAKDDMNSIEFGANPKENFVANTDVRLALDNQHIILKGVGSVSLINTDITSGTYSDDVIDSIFANGNGFSSDVESFKSVKNLISPFITVNQFVEPVSFTNLPSLAAEGSLELNYFNNNLKSSYIYRGSQFKSFGQEYVRTDIAGINISDRFRTLQNQLFFTLGYENLSDNLQGTKLATTSFQTLRASASLFMRVNMPSITLSYINNKNESETLVADSLSYFSGVDDITNRFSLNLGYDFNLKVRHVSSLSFVTSNRVDNSFANYDANYFSTSFMVSSYWTKSLVSNFSVIYYDSEISLNKYKYVTLSMGGRYLMFNDDIELSLNYSPSFGDFNRHSIDFIATYQAIKNLWLRGQMRYYITSTGTNVISGLTISYNF